jgi:hypothetical protein
MGKEGVSVYVQAFTQIQITNYGFTELRSIYLSTNND